VRLRGIMQTILRPGTLCRGKGRRQGRDLRRLDSYKNTLAGSKQELCKATKVVTRDMARRYARLKSGNQPSLAFLRAGTDGGIHENQRPQYFEGKDHGRDQGQTTTHVVIDIGGGVTIFSSITNEAAEELNLNKGQPASAVIKASDVMVGVD
jgi:molybdopterin-binding protein